MLTDWFPSQKGHWKSNLAARLTPGSIGNSPFVEEKTILAAKIWHPAPDLIAADVLSEVKKVEQNARNRTAKVGAVTEWQPSSGGLS